MSARTIWKFPLELKSDIELEVPAHYQPLFVAEQNGALCLWIEVIPDADKELMHVAICGTGHTIPMGFEYIGSVMQDLFVWHVYYNRS